MEKNKMGVYKFADALKSAEGEEEEKEEKKEKTSPITVVLNRTPFDMFRYSLTGLLVVVKLGLLSYLSVNPLATVSWWLVFLPAYVVEAALLAFVVALGLAAVVVGFAALIWISFKIMVIEPIRRKKFQKKLDAAEKSDAPTGDTAIDLAVALRKAIGGLESRSPLDGLDEIK